MIFNSTINHEIWRHDMLITLKHYISKSYSVGIFISVQLPGNVESWDVIKMLKTFALK